MLFQCLLDKTKQLRRPHVSTLRSPNDDSPSLLEVPSPAATALLKSLPSNELSLPGLRGWKGSADWTVPGNCFEEGLAQAAS